MIKISVAERREESGPGIHIHKPTGNSAAFHSDDQ